MLSLFPRGIDRHTWPSFVTWHQPWYDFWTGRVRMFLLTNSKNVSKASPQHPKPCLRCNFFAFALLHPPFVCDSCSIKMCLVIFVSVRLQSVQLSWEMYFKMLSFDRTYTLLLRAVFVLFGSSEGDFLSLCSQINTLKCDCVQKGLPLVYTCPLCNYKAQESHLQLRWHLTISAQNLKFSLSFGYPPTILGTFPVRYCSELSTKET